MQRPFQLSLRLLFGLFAGIGVCLGATQVHHVLGGLALAACSVTLAIIPLHPIEKRTLIYGGVFGFALVVIVALLVDGLFFFPGSRPLIGLGPGADFARSYGVPLGAIGGATIAYSGACIWANKTMRRRGM